jgi:hypothetical protein
VDASKQGAIITAEGSEQFIPWAYGKSMVEESGRIKTMITVYGFPDSEKLSLMNRLLMILESEFDPINQQSRVTVI